MLTPFEVWGGPILLPGGGGQPVLSFEQCFIYFSFAFVVGGLGFEFCVFVARWRHALRSEWPFIIIIIIIMLPESRAVFYFIS